MTENNLSNTMVFFASIKDCIDALNLSAESKVIYYEGIINYGLYGTEPNFDNPLLNAIFIALKPNIDANTRKMEQKMRNSINGKKGGRPTHGDNAEKTDEKKGVKTSKKTTAKTTPKTTPKTIDIDKDKDIDNDVDVDKDNDIDKAKDSSCSLAKGEKEQGGKEKENSSTRSRPTDIDTRNDAFYQSLVPFVGTYGTESIQQFYDYWSEPNANGTRMRYELEPTWNLPYRLERWMKQRKRLRL